MPSSTMSQIHKIIITRRLKSQECHLWNPLHVRSNEVSGKNNLTLQKSRQYEICLRLSYKRKSIPTYIRFMNSIQFPFAIAHLILISFMTKLPNFYLGLLTLGLSVKDCQTAIHLHSLFPICPLG